jgi:Family of unknown function (DUF5681)
LPSDRVGDYEVGYKKPPKETRFQKGNNANPRARPRGSKSLAKLLEQALDRSVTVVEGGTRRRRMKRDVVIAQLVDQSAGADLRATKLLLDMLQKLNGGGPRLVPRSHPPTRTPMSTSSSGRSSRVWPLLKRRKRVRRTRRQAPIL